MLCTDDKYLTFLDHTFSRGSYAASFLLGKYTCRFPILKRLNCFIVVIKLKRENLIVESVCCRAYCISLTVCREAMNAFNPSRHFPYSRISKDKTSKFITTIRRSADNMFRLSLLKNLSANYNHLSRCKLTTATFWTDSTISNQYVWIKHKGFPRHESNASKTGSKIVWIDMEMTGLSVENDRIMEIACVVTDKNLNIRAEHPSIVIKQPDSLLDTMTEWCIKTHTQVWACTLILVSLTPANECLCANFDETDGAIGRM